MSRTFKNYISTVEEAVKDSNIPPPFRRWAALSSVAGALGRKCWYDFGAFQVRPNLYICLIAGPGQGKSLSLILPFDKIMRDLSSEPGKTMDDDGFNMGLMQYGLEAQPLHVIRDRITPEKLSQLMVLAGRQDNELSTLDQAFMSSDITLVSSEFGTFMNRADHYLQMFLTEVWDSPDQQTYRTKTAGDDLIEGPYLNWIGCSTPEQFVTNLPENARTQGLLSRIIPVYHKGERAPQSLWYGKPQMANIEALRHDLADIAKIKGQFRFHDDVKDKANSDVEKGLTPTPTDPNLAEYLERRPAQFVKVAMCISASKNSDRVITEEDWEETKALMFATEESMPEALQQFGVGKAGRLAFDMKDFLGHMVESEGRTGIPISIFKRELIRRVAQAGEVDQVMKAMEDANLITVDGKMVIPFGNKNPTSKNR